MLATASISTACSSTPILTSYKLRALLFGGNVKVLLSSETLTQLDYLSVDVEVSRLLYGENHSSESSASRYSSLSASSSDFEEIVAARFAPANGVGEAARLLLLCWKL